MQVSDPERFEWAVRLMEQGKCGEALPTLQELAGRNPGRPPIFLAIGQCLFDSGKPAEAEPALRRAVELAPALPQGHFLLGSVLGTLNRGNEAMKELREAVRLAPDFAPAYRVMGMFQVEHQQFLPEARQALETAIRLDPADSRAHYWLGRFFQGIKDLESAARSFEAALKREPDSSQARLGLAQVFCDLGEFEKARTEFDWVLTREPNSYAALLGRARCLYSLQEHTAALTLAKGLEKKEAGATDQRQLYWLLARLYRALGQKEEALAAENRLREFEREIEKGLANFWETGKESP